MRDRQIPPEAKLYASAFDAYLRARPDGRDERLASDRMTALLRVITEKRLSREPVRSHVHRAVAA